MSTDSLSSLRDRLREFARDRDWDQFHHPKNLCCALSVEAAELLEVFQWSSSEDVPTHEQRDKASEEIADVLIYLVRLADKLEIDPIEAAELKVARNAARYPVATAKGSSKKHSEL